MQRGVGDTYAQDPGIEPFAAEPPAVSALPAAPLAPRTSDLRTATEAVRRGRLNGGSQIQVSGTCGQETTAGSLNGGSKITGSGCEYWDYNDPNM